MNNDEDQIRLEIEGHVDVAMQDFYHSVMDDLEYMNLDRIRDAIRTLHNRVRVEVLNQPEFVTIEDGAPADPYPLNQQQAAVNAVIEAIQEHLPPPGPRRSAYRGVINAEFKQFERNAYDALIDYAPGEFEDYGQEENNENNENNAQNGGVRRRKSRKMRKSRKHSASRKTTRRVRRHSRK